MNKNADAKGYWLLPLSKPAPFAFFLNAAGSWTYFIRDGVEYSVFVPGVSLTDGLKRLIDFEESEHHRVAPDDFWLWAGERLKELT